MAPTHGDAWRSSGGYCTDSGGGASVQSDEGGRGGADAEREEVAARGGGCFMDNSDDASTRSEEGGRDGAGGEREEGAVVAAQTAEGRCCRAEEGGAMLVVVGAVAVARRWLLLMCAAPLPPSSLHDFYDMNSWFVGAVVGT